MKIGKLKTIQTLELDSDNGDESDYSDSLVEAERDKEGMSEDIDDRPAQETESNEGEIVLFTANTSRHHTKAMKCEAALAILRTCRQIYAEASPIFHSMLEVMITPEEVVHLHHDKEIVQRSANMTPQRYWRHDHLAWAHRQGIYEALGWGYVLDFATWSKIERIEFDADYNFLLMDDSPSLYIDEHFHTSPNDEAKLISFMKRTRTVENFVSLLATLPRVRHLSLTLVIEVRPHMDFALDSDDEDEETHRLNFEKMAVANERATELFLECGMLDPLRKLSNVENFEFEVQSESRNDDLDFMVLKPKHARMAQDLKEAIERNCGTRRRRVSPRPSLVEVIGRRTADGM